MNIQEEVINMKVEFNTVYYEIKDDIGYVVINDPPANKMTALFLTEFIILVREHIVQSRVKGIIISGSGRHYSSGADVDQLMNIFGTQSKLDSKGKLVAYPSWYQENRNTFNYFYNVNIPVISSITGLCVGSGTELALSSHLRICGSGSILGLPESSFGFLPGVNGTLRYTELLGFGKALELILAGETFSAEEAKDLGLVDVVVNRKDTMNYCEALMKFIIQNKKEYSKHNVMKYLEDFKKIY
jgi:enoyl-CoA hydratase/carnithine racemase